MMEQSIMTMALINARQSSRTTLENGQTRWRRTSSMLSIGRQENGYQFWHKVEDRRKDFNVVWIRIALINFCTFEQSKSIQEVQSVLHCKTIQLLPEGFTEYVYHVGNGKRIEVKSERWFDSRRSQSLNKQTSCRVQEYRILGSFQQRWLQFYQTRSNAVILCGTVFAEFIVKASCMKTKDQLYQRESEILRPRVVLKVNSQCDSQDVLAKNKIIFGIAAMPRATTETRSNTVKLQDARRQNIVTKLIKMSEKHQHKDQFRKDMSQKQEINRFSEEEQKLLDDMNQTEIFELCESMSWLQCFFRNRNHLLQSCDNPEEQLRFHFNPWLCHWLEDRNTVHLKDKWCFSRRRRCLRKQDKRNMGTNRRFSWDCIHKKNTENRWQSTMLANIRIALERHDYTVTWAERLENAKHWTLRLNADGPQKLLRQRPDFAVASKPRRPLGGNETISETDASRTSTTATTTSAIGRVWKLWFLCWSKIWWRYYREPRGNLSLLLPPAAFSSSILQWQISRSCQPTYSEKWWWFRFPGRNSKKSTGGVDRTPHSQCTSVQCSLGGRFVIWRASHPLSFLSALAPSDWHFLGMKEALQITDLSPQFVHKRRTHTQRAWLKNCKVIFVRLKRILSSGVFHVSTLVVLCLSPRALHLPHSLFLLRHKNTQQDLCNESNREHSTHPAHLQVPSVDKLRHQESLWREDLLSGGNPRTTTPTGHEPKKLATVSREEDHRVPTR